jgi:hypothetical protein
VNKFNDQGQSEKKSSEDNIIIDRLRDKRNRRKAEKQNSEHQNFLSDDFIQQIDQLNEVTSTILSRETFFPQMNVKEENKIIEEMNLEKRLVPNPIPSSKETPSHRTDKKGLGTITLKKKDIILKHSMQKE